MQIDLHALVCSQDHRTAKVLQVLLTEMSITMELCGTHGDAMRHLVSRRFDGVFVDGGLDDSAQLLRDIKQSPGAERAVSFAILEGMTSVKQAFSFGAGFILYKPLAVEKTRTSLRAAHGLMMRERRRHFRHTLEGVTATLQFPGVPQKTAEILDLSEGGMALHLLEYTERRGEVQAQFQLPGLSRPMHVDGEITWADDHGRVGMHFSSMADADRGALATWLSERGKLVAQDAPAELKTRARRRAVGGRVAAVSAVKAAASVLPVEPAPVVTAPVVTARVDLPRQRETIRAGVDVEVTVLAYRGDRPLLLKGTCDDISVDGLGADLVADLCPGEPVLLHLSLPSLESAKVHGIVRHRKNDRIGFEFVGLSAEQRRQLSEVCDALPVAESTASDLAGDGVGA